MKPWFANTRPAKIVRAAVLTRMSVADLCKRPKLLQKETGITKATPAEVRAATAMKEDWDGETRGKVRQAIEASRSTGLNYR